MEKCKHGIIKETCSLCRGFKQTKIRQSGKPQWMMKPEMTEKEKQFNFIRTEIPNKRWDVTPSDEENRAFIEYDNEYE